MKTISRNSFKMLRFIFLFFIIINFLFADLQVQADAYHSIGKMKPFWRSQPVIGRWLSQGQGLIEIPDYLSRTSFPYTKRPHRTEVPFADNLIVVRLLGGWNDKIKKGESNGSRKADLLYRDEKGKIRYRWHLLASRLDPYINAGYTKLTIVLDNTPWALPATPHIEHFGQTAPPKDMKVWGSFIEELCKQLVRLYGYETVSTWRFRQGTECQSKRRFFGTQKEYLKQYDYAAAAVKKILPGAKFGPFNQAGGKMKPANNNVDYLSVVKHCLSGKNSATGKTGTPIDFVSISSYYTSATRKTGKVPGFIRRAQVNNNFFEQVASLDSNISNTPKEVHEFGILDRVPGSKKTDEPGAYGAAVRFHIMMDMRSSGISRLAHWNVTQKLPSREPKYLLKGEGWLYSILEYMIDGDSFIQTVKSPDTNVYYKILAIKTEKRYFFIIGSLHHDKEYNGIENIRLAFPKSWSGNLAKYQIKMTELTRDNAIFDVIRHDLVAAKLLNTPFEKSPDTVGKIRDMTDKQGLQFILSRWSGYEQKMVDSLTLKGYQDRIRKKILTFKVKTPGLTVVVIDRF